jgi:hypothetical protein
LCYIVLTVQDNQGGYFHGAKQLKVSLCQLKIRFKWQETLEELTAQISMVQVVVLALAPWRIQNKKRFFFLLVLHCPRKPELLETLKIGITVA